MRLLAVIQGGLQTFYLEVVVESNGGQMRLRPIVRLKYNNINTWILELKIAVLFAFAQSQLITQLNHGPVRRDGLKSVDPREGNGGSLPVRSVADLQCHRRDRLGVYPVG